MVLATIALLASAFSGSAANIRLMAAQMYPPELIQKWKIVGFDGEARSQRDSGEVISLTWHLSTPGRKITPDQSDSWPLPVASINLTILPPDVSGREWIQDHGLDNMAVRKLSDLTSFGGPVIGEWSVASKSRQLLEVYAGDGRFLAVARDYTVRGENYDTSRLDEAVRQLLESAKKGPTVQVLPCEAFRLFTCPVEASVPGARVRSASFGKYAKTEHWNEGPWMGIGLDIEGHGTLSIRTQVCDTAKEAQGIFDEAVKSDTALYGNAIDRRASPSRATFRTARGQLIVIANEDRLMQILNTDEGRGLQPGDLEDLAAVLLKSYRNHVLKTESGNRD